MGHLLGLEHPFDREDGDWAVIDNKNISIYNKAKLVEFLTQTGLKLTQE